MSIPPRSTKRYTARSQARMNTLIEQLIRAALDRLPDEAVARAAQQVPVEVERTRDPAHGDYASNIGLRLAKPARQSGRTLAQSIVAALPSHPSIAKVEVAGAGFINFFLRAGAHHDALMNILRLDEKFGDSTAAEGRSVLVEFVSANPTGPLHVGHGRHAAYGASVANLLEAVGFNVGREYYVNDDGRQMEILGVSLWLRYLECCGETFAFPANGYRGDYLLPFAQDLRAAAGDDYRLPAQLVFADLPADAPEGDKDEYIDAVIVRAKSLLGAAAFEQIRSIALQEILRDIREDLGEFGVTFDVWFSERSLADDASVSAALTRLEAEGMSYLKDGALWFKSTQFGDEKDRVMVRDNGVRTYFASDIAYAANKFARGFEHLLYIWGADHHGYVARLRAGIAASGGDVNAFEVRLVQFVTLYRGGEKAQMSTRSGEFITLRALRAEVGNDAARLFYVLRSNDQHLDFDVDLAQSRSNDNPVYYIQYAHARVASVMRQLAERGMALEPAAAQLELLTQPQEAALVQSLVRYPEVIAQSAAQRAPHLLVHYLREAANHFHACYAAHQVLVADAGLRNARLVLARATQIVIRNGLALLGVSAPDSM